MVKKKAKIIKKNIDVALYSEKCIVVARAEFSEEVRNTYD